MPQRPPERNNQDFVIPPWNRPNQNWNVENKPGANNTIGAAEVAKPTPTAPPS